MLLETIPEKNIDTAITQVNNLSITEESLSSIFVKTGFHSNPMDVFLSNWHKENFYSISLKMEPVDLKNNTTWEENYDDDFEIITKLNFNKTFKVKSRIIAITKYSPKIIID